ncbi:MAG: hypothetical protein NTW00_11790 [Hyphomicrobiales bacterium]|nr:hypothetical protein [Hyphomicrobiales bacterium]
MNVARRARHRERSEAIQPCHHIVLDGFAALGMAGLSPPALITSPLAPRRALAQTRT